MNYSLFQNAILRQAFRKHYIGFEKPDTSLRAGTAKIKIMHWNSHCMADASFFSFTPQSTPAHPPLKTGQPAEMMNTKWGVYKTWKTANVKFAKQNDFVRCNKLEWNETYANRKR